MIYDTNHYETPTIIFDGTTYKPPPFTSSGNVLRVRFISDGATTKKGFSFSYQQVGEQHFFNQFSILSNFLITQPSLLS